VPGSAATAARNCRYLARRCVLLSSDGRQLQPQGAIVTEFGRAATNGAAGGTRR
jgi:hypothetical protein